MKKNKIVQYECPNCHQLYPEWIPQTKISTVGKLIQVLVHPQFCNWCRVRLQRHVTKVKK